MSDTGAPLKYEVAVECPHCRCRCYPAVEAEVEPPPDHCFQITCPNDSSRHRIGFRYFKKVDQLPPDAPPARYPPRPEPPPKRWWQFWRS